MGCNNEDGRSEKEMEMEKFLMLGFLIVKGKLLVIVGIILHLRYVIYMIWKEIVMNMLQKE